MKYYPSVKKHPKLNKEMKKRDQKLRSLYYEGGLNCREISEREGLTLVRVHQIVKKKRT